MNCKSLSRRQLNGFIHGYCALVRKGFYQDFPVEVTEFLSRLFIPLEDLEQIMAQANETSYDAAVQHYINQNPKRVNYWVTGGMGE